MILRPVLARKASLEEIERWWSFSDLIKMHEAMDIQEEMQEFIESRPPKK